MERENNILNSSKTPHHGENIKRFRGLRGIKQVTLAEMAGKKERWLYDLEKKQVIDDEMLQLLAKHLQVHIDILKNYTDDCGVQITFNGENTTNSGNYQYQPNFNDLVQFNEIIKPLYNEIREKEIEIFKLKEKLSNG